MLKKYFPDTVEALEFRKTTEIPHLGRIIFISVVLILLYIALAIKLVPSSEGVEFNFVSERGAITAFSAVLLALASAFSFGTVLLKVRKGERCYSVWFVLMLGFLFLAFDELLLIHEIIGAHIGEVRDAGSFKNWNDVVVIVYGMIAVPIGAFYFSELLRYKMVIELFVVGFIFYIAHTYIDSVFHDPTPQSIIYEESYKLFSVGFLAIGSFVGFLEVLWNRSFEKAK